MTMDVVLETSKNKDCQYRTCAMHFTQEMCKRITQSNPRDIGSVTDPDPGNDYFGLLFDRTRFMPLEELHLRVGEILDTTHAILRKPNGINFLATFAFVSMKMHSILFDMGEPHLIRDAAKIRDKDALVTASIAKLRALIENGVNPRPPAGGAGAERIAELEQMLSEQGKHLATAEDFLQRARDTVGTQHGRIDFLHSENSQLARDLEAARAEVQRLREAVVAGDPVSAAEIQRLTGQLRESERTCYEANEELALVQAQLAQVVGERDAASEASAAAMNENSAVKRLLEQSRAELNAKAAELELSTACATSQRDLSDMLTRELDTTRDELEKAKADHEKQIAAVRSEHGGLLAQYEMIKGSCVEWEKSVQGLTEAASKSMERFRALQQENEDLRSQLQAAKGPAEGAAAAAPAPAPAPAAAAAAAAAAVAKGLISSGVIGPGASKKREKVVVASEDVEEVDATHEAEIPTAMVGAGRRGRRASGMAPIEVKTMPGVATVDIAGSALGSKSSGL
jgi:predicted  nucleic acid-binding Zn-ribbon protein